MLKPLFGSPVREQVLIFIFARNTGYATEIARFFGANLSEVQKQLSSLELGAVLVSQSVGRTRIYQFNSRYAFLTELRNLLEKALRYYPEDVQENLTLNRRRPRRKKKPL